MKLTPARQRGLDVIAACEPRDARESNVTDLRLGLVYWQTARWLVEHGLAYYPTGSTLLALTPAGRDEVS